jgi:hypothetical protein
MPSPWATSVVRLDATGLPSGADVATTDLNYPWGVVLTNGEQCLAAQGAHGRFGSQFVNYFCSGGAMAALQLLGTVDRSTAYWTYQSAIADGPNLSAGPTVSVADAWYAGPAPISAPACQGPEVSVTSSEPLGSDGMAWLVFQNTSSSACSLYGYPGVAALNSAGDQFIQIARMPAGQEAPLTNVVIPSGGAASAVLNGDPDYPNGTCPTFHELLVTPPNTRTSRPVQVGNLTICGNAQIEPVTVEGTPVSWS